MVVFFLCAEKEADVYVGWYTQLRALVRSHPKLESDLHIMPLPGGGFRGDLFLGVISGSASINLGKNIIHTLTTKSEEYKRLSRGVGLPTRQSFYSATDANKAHMGLWPHSNNSLSDVLEIYLNAHSRSDIYKYREIHGLFAHSCRKLFYEIKDDVTLVENITDALYNLSERMKWMIHER